MELLVQTSDNCLLYAAAMVLNIKPQSLITLIGHNGEEVWWPKQTGSKKKRSFHPQEILDAAATYGKTFICIEFMPSSGWGGNGRLIFNEEMMEKRFLGWLTNRAAILIVQGPRLGHAVAWDGKKIYDPKGMIKDLYDYTIQEAWILQKLI